MAIGSKEAEMTDSAIIVETRLETDSSESSSDERTFH